MTMTEESVTRNQARLIANLREVEAEIARLNRRRNSIKTELERIYPAWSERELVAPPKEQGVVISIWNYERENCTAQITATAKGRKALESFDPTLKPLDFTILALVVPRAQGADATKLLAVDVVKGDDVKEAKRRIRDLVKFGYLDIKYTTKPPQQIGQS